MKSIKRTYMTKHGLVTKIYNYNHKSTKGKILVNKKGVVYKNNVNELKSDILNNPNYSDAEKRTALANIDAMVEQRHKHPTGKPLTQTGMMGKMAEDEITRMFANAGYSVEDVADELGVSEEDILNQDNWNNDVFMGKWRFTFTYTGAIMEPVEE